MHAMWAAAPAKSWNWGISTCLDTVGLEIQTWRHRYLSTPPAWLLIAYTCRGAFGQGQMQRRSPQRRLATTYPRHAHLLCQQHTPVPPCQPAASWGARAWLFAHIIAIRGACVSKAGLCDMEALGQMDQVSAQELQA